MPLNKTGLCVTVLMKWQLKKQKQKGRGGREGKERGRDRGLTLHQRRMLSSKCGESSGTGKSPFGDQHSKEWLGQESPEAKYQGREDTF